MQGGRPTIGGMPSGGMTEIGGVAFGGQPVIGGGKDYVDGGVAEA